MSLIKRVYVNFPRHVFVTLASLFPELCWWIWSRKCWLMPSQPPALPFQFLASWGTFTSSQIGPDRENKSMCDFCFKLICTLRVKSRISICHMWTTHSAGTHCQLNAYLIGLKTWVVRFLSADSFWCKMWVLTAANVGWMYSECRNMEESDLHIVLQCGENVAKHWFFIL